MEQKTKACEICKTAFKFRESKRFCSGACRWAAWSKRCATPKGKIRVAKAPLSGDHAEWTRYSYSNPDMWRRVYCGVLLHASARTGAWSVAAEGDVLRQADNFADATKQAETHAEKLTGIRHFWTNPIWEDVNK